MKFFNVSMWVDEHVTIQVLAEDAGQAEVRAAEALSAALGGGDITHGIFEVEEIIDNT